MLPLRVTRRSQHRERWKRRRGSRDRRAAASLLARHDARYDFGVNWVLFDTTKVHPKAAGFGTSVFDGRYLYLAGGVIARFDAKSPASRPCLPSFFGSFY
jgi:hypothetical protein